MKKTVKYIGLDVHKNSISIAIAEDGQKRKVNFYGVINNDMDQLHKFLRKQISQGAEPRCVYEAGPCGYNIYRSLKDKNIDCVVIAPSLIPKKVGTGLRRIEEMQKLLQNCICQTDQPSLLDDTVPANKILKRVRSSWIFSG